MDEPENEPRGKNAPDKKPMQRACLLSANGNKIVRFRTLTLKKKKNTDKSTLCHLPGSGKEKDH